MLFIKISFFCIKNLFKYIFLYDNTYYDNLFLELSKINIIFIKIFQWLSSEKIIDKKYINYLNKYLDNCPYDENSINKETLLNLIDYSKKNNYNLQIPSFIPYKCGSINLVFIGYLDNKKIIIKILRNNIREKVEESILFFNYLGYIFYYIFYYYNIQNIIYDIIDKNKNILLDQINLKRELENIKLFKHKYKNTEYILIPDIYEEFTEKFNNLIVMEFIDGKTIHNINNEDKEIFINLLFKYNYSFIEKEIIHGDLHIGNILFCKIDNKYKIGLIDFGIIFKLNKSELDLTYYLFKSKDIYEFLKTLFKLLKNHLNYRNNKEKNIDSILENILIEISEFCINNPNLLKNSNFLDINIIKYLLYRLNYHNLEINGRISNLLISLSIINSLCLYFTDIDTISKNKELINICKKFDLD